MRIVVGVGNLVQRIRDGRTGWVLGGWEVERLSGAVSLKTKVDDL
jgi:hypothetical protein